jgi:hypothetical protein
MTEQRRALQMGYPAGSSDGFAVIRRGIEMHEPRGRLERLSEQDWEEEGAAHGGNLGAFVSERLRGQFSVDTEVCMKLVRAHIDGRRCLGDDNTRQLTGA